MSKLSIDEFTKSGALKRGDDEYFNITRVASGLPQLDRVIGGGFAYGRNTLCVGPESTGKTLIAQYLAAAVQKEGRGVLLVDAEHSYDRDWWARSGVDPKSLLINQPTIGEDAVNIMVAMMADPNMGLIILDSIATLTPGAVMEKASGERTVASLANLVTNMYAKIMPLNGHIIFFAINQLRDNMSGYEDVFPGGKAQRYNSHLRLHTRRIEWINEDKQRVGYEMEVHVRKNKIGPPEGHCKISVRFEGQMDLLSSYVDEALERGIIKSAGPWYQYHEQKVLGKDNLRNLFLEDGAEGLIRELAIA